MIQHPAVLFFLACMGALAGLGLAYVLVYVLAWLGVFKEYRQ